WISIAVAVTSFLMIRGTPESKVNDVTEPRHFDWIGLMAFVIGMVALNVTIAQGSVLGWLSPAALILMLVFVLSGIVFFKVEGSSAQAFVELSLFRNRTFSGATLSNFLLNGAAGTLLVVLTLVQQQAGLSSLQSGLLTAGYLIAILSTIRVG